MKPQLRNGLIIGGLALAIIGIGIYFKRQYNLLYNACYTIAGGVVHNLGLNNVKITLFWKIVNESDLTIEISDMVFGIYVNKMFVSKILKPEKQILYSKSDAIIKLDFEFNPKDLLHAGLTNIEPILYDKEKLVITTKGTFSAKTGIVKLKEFPFEDNITLKELITPSDAPKKC
jgi:LEA14-like dessication related protein